MKYLVCLLLFLLSINLSSHFDFRINENQIEQFISQEPFKSYNGKYSDCVNDLKSLIISTTKMERWALHMFDSWSKFQSGYLYGNIFSVGNYEQCLNIYENHSNHIIKGQYCTLVFYSTDDKSSISNFINVEKWAKLLNIETTEQIYKIINYYKITYGICLPHSCTSDSLNDLWKLIEKQFKIDSLEIIAYDLLCDHQNKPILPFPVDFWIFMFFAIVIIIVILSTIYDILTHNNVNQNDYFVAFSIYTNTKKLLSTKLDKDTLSCLHGIKTISILWIILGHRFLVNLFLPSINEIVIISWLNSMQMVLIILAELAVDTFLTISGILLIYTKLTYSKTGKLTITSLYINRLIRLFPALIATICFHIAIFKYLGQGPVWQALMQKVANVCYHTWWITLLQLTNFLSIEYQCLEQSWYLSVDSQLYFLSPIILFNIEKYPKQTFFGIISVLLSSTIYTFIITINNNYGNSLLDLSSDYLNNLYYPTFVRMPPWLIGIITGYFIYNYKKRNFKLSKLMNLTLWFVFLSLFFGIIFYHVVLVKFTISPLHSAIFNAFCKQIWSISICWIVFACSTNHGGVINEFLSLPIFRILGKLTYSMFLVNVGVLLVLVGNFKTHSHFSSLSSYHDFFGDIMFTLICSTVLCLCFESPFLALIKIFNKKQQERTSLILYDRDTTE